MNVCSICHTIPEQVSEGATGGELDGDPLPEAVGLLETVGAPLFRRSTSQSNTRILRCPECGAYFRWRYEYEWAPTGSYDDIYVQRLTPDEASGPVAEIEAQFAAARAEFEAEKPAILRVLRRGGRGLKAKAKLLEQRQLQGWDVSFAADAVWEALLGHLHHKSRCVGLTLEEILRRWLEHRPADRPAWRRRVAGHLDVEEVSWLDSSLHYYDTCDALDDPTDPERLLDAVAFFDRSLSEAHNHLGRLADALARHTHLELDCPGEAIAEVIRRILAADRSHRVVVTERLADAETPEARALYAELAHSAEGGGETAFRPRPAPAAPETYAIVFSPDSQRMLTHTTDGTIAVWTRDAEAIARRKLPNSPAWSAVWTPDGARFAGTDGCEVYLWTADGDKVRGWRRTLHHTGQLAWNVDGSRLLAFSAFGRLAVFDQKRLDVAVQLDPRLTRCVAWRSDGEQLVASGGHSPAKLYSKDGTLLGALGERRNRWPTWWGETLLTFGEREPTEHWGTEPLQLIGTRKPWNAGAVAVHGDRIAAAVGANLRLDDRRLKMPGVVRCLVWSPDGDLLAVATTEGEVLIVDRQGVETGRITGAKYAMLVWSPDSRFLGLIAGFNAGLIADRRGRVILEAPVRANRVTFSPDGSLVAFAAAPNGQPQLYDVPAP
jgi:WD40 repeat protein